MGRFISIAPSSAHIFPFQPVFNSPWGLATCGPVGGAPLPEDAAAPCGFGIAAIGAAIGDALGFGAAALPGGGYAGGRGPLATLASTSSKGTAGGGKGGVGGKAGAGNGGGDAGAGTGAGGGGGTPGGNSLKVFLPLACHQTCH